MIFALAFRWRIFLKQQSLDIPASTVLGLTWAGQFFNSVLPGSTGGDFVKIYQVCRLAPERKAAAAASVIVDRFTALIALVGLAAISLFYGRALPDLSLKSLPGPGWAWLAGGAIVAAILAVALFKIGGSPHWVSRLRQIFSALRTSFTPNRAFFLGLVIAIGVHMLNVTIFFGFARALGIPITYFQAFSFFPIVLFLLLIPVTVNGHGLREMLLLFYFTHLHIILKSTAGAGPMETVFSLSLLGVANDLLWNLPGGLWYLLTLGKRPRD
jgi:uncharacterized membrane protein YbhN (UPF0104 family)